MRHYKRGRDQLIAQIPELCLQSDMAKTEIAHLAGLGGIGKSCLLITPKAGPRVRWVTVRTDSPLQPTGQPLEERCGDCQKRVEICPVGASSGRPFREDEPRETRYDARKCENYFKDLEKKTGLGVCGLCLYVCPFGRWKRSPREEDSLVIDGSLDGKRDGTT